MLQANEQAIEDGTWSWKQGLVGRRFALALSGAGGGGAASGAVGAFTVADAGGGTGAGTRVTLWGAGLGDADLLESRASCPHHQFVGLRPRTFGP